MPKYDSLNKDQLVEEIKNRRAKGSPIAVDLRLSEELLRTALEVDDVSNGETDEDKTKESNPPLPAAKPVKQVKPLTGELNNQLPLQPEMPTHATQPSEDAFSKAQKYRHLGDGYIYEVIRADSDITKPYKARVPRQASGHPGLFWEGSDEEFKDTFTKI